MFENVSHFELQEQRRLLNANHSGLVMPNEYVQWAATGEETASEGLI